MIWTDTRVVIQSQKDKYVLDAYSVADSGSMGGIQTCTVVVQGRFLQDGRSRVRYVEAFKPGDLFTVDAETWNGQAGWQGTLIDGLLIDVVETETLTEKGYVLSTTFTAESMQSVLARDVVQYSQFYGTEVGFLRAWATLNTSRTDFTPASIAQRYLEDIAYQFGMWRNGAPLADVLGYGLTSLKARSPIFFDLAVQQGTHWSIMQPLMDAPLHEMFCVTTPSSKDGVQGDFKRVGTPSRGRFGGRTSIVLRPSPYPFGTSAGKVSAREWRKLKLYDLTVLDERTFPTGNSSASRSGRSVKNYFLVYPSLEAMTETLAIAASIGLRNLSSMNRFGFSPLIIRSHMLDSTLKEQDFIEFSKDLTWRLAVQQNRLDEMYSIPLDVPLMPEIAVGERIQFLSPFQGEVFEGHISGRSHQWVADRGGKTTINIERALPKAIYDNAESNGWFEQGLEEFRVSAQQAIPSADN